MYTRFTGKGRTFVAGATLWLMWGVIAVVVVYGSIAAGRTVAARWNSPPRTRAVPVQRPPAVVAQPQMERPVAAPAPPPRLLPPLLSAPAPKREQTWRREFHWEWHAGSNRQSERDKDEAKRRDMQAQRERDAQRRRQLEQERQRASKPPPVPPVARPPASRPPRTVTPGTPKGPSKAVPPAQRSKKNPQGGKKSSRKGQVNQLAGATKKRNGDYRSAVT